MTNKDIIKQYVDTGIRIPQYQLDKLGESLLKTYLRKRYISAYSIIKNAVEEYGELTMDERDMDNLLYDSEMENLTDEQKKDYLSEIITKKYIDLSDRQMEWCDKPMLKKYLYNLYNYAGGIITDEQYDILDDDLKEYWDNL